MQNVRYTTLESEYVDAETGEFIRAPTSEETYEIKDKIRNITGTSKHKYIKHIYIIKNYGKINQTLF